MDPRTTIEIASIGGTFSQQEYRIAWMLYPEHRELLDAAANEQHGGWNE